MADISGDKKLKLANTRKRFKELQELKKKRNENQSQVKNDNLNCSSESSQRNTPIEPYVTQVDIPDNNEAPRFTDTQKPEFGTSSNLPQNMEFRMSNIHLNESNKNFNRNSPMAENINTVNEETSSIANFFGSSNYTSTGTFFDNLSSTSALQKPDSAEPPTMSFFNISHAEPKQQNIGKARYFDHSEAAKWENSINQEQEKPPENYSLFPSEEGSGSKHTSPVHKECKNDDSLTLDDPEIKQNEICDYIRKSAENLAVAPYPDYFEKSLENIFSANDTQKLMDYLGTSRASENEEKDMCDINEEIDSTSDLAKKEIQHSNVESLRQLSDQLAQMIEPSNYEYSSSESITDLEKRNIELAAHLEREKLSSEQLKVVNSELQKRIAQLELDLKNRDVGTELQSNQEISMLKGELQAHLQTIGLLVAEKTELSSNLSQYELSSKGKTAECEELQARLKASRGRVADLERELNNVKTEMSRSSGVEEHYIDTIEKFKQEYKVLKEQKDELAQDVLEVRERLKKTSEENLELQKENKDLAGKLSLADVKIQQLSSGGSVAIDNKIEQLTQEKFALEGEITILNQMLQNIIKERDEATVQYQQYAQQLNAQVNNLSSKLEKLQQENQHLTVQEQNRAKHFAELEKQLQNYQNLQITYNTGNSTDIELKGELERIRELCVQLQIEKTTAEENYTKVSNEKELLLKDLNNKIDSISQLESMVEQLKGNQPDSVKLLATMESDKVAASRAIQQNKELKSQLESMQEVIMKMNNDKVELTENFKAQQLTNKELIEKLQKTELTLQSLADAIDIKDKELLHLRNTSEEMNRQALHHEQLEDRLRHYEAHNNSAHHLQHELQEAKQTIGKLQSELNKIKDQKNQNTTEDVELQEARRRIVDLTNEINKLRSLQGDLTNELNQGQDKIDNSNIKEETGNSNKGFQNEEDKDNNENALDKENAMKYLEEKVKKTMQEIADLTDEKQRLEHIVFQLQHETETIGEYVALYQHQRMILKQRTLEKDQQLKQLASDREQIKVKLDRLNQLIRKLVSEKGTLPEELIQHQQQMDSQLSSFCDEHSKMHHEISQITKDQSNIVKPITTEPGSVEAQSNVAQSQTAEEIITLLSEIKTSNLVQPDENFHHCPWCSGQLITV